MTDAVIARLPGLLDNGGRPRIIKAIAASIGEIRRLTSAIIALNFGMKMVNGEILDKAAY